MTKTNQNQSQVAYPSRSGQVISLEKGKFPPQDINLEEVIIGAMLIDGTAITEVMEVIGKEPVFYKDAHQIIYNAMIELFEENEKIDLLTVSAKLKKINKLEAVGGEFYLIQITQKVHSAAHIEYHCRIIMQLYVKRQSIKVGHKIIEKSYNEDTDIFDLLADCQKDIDNTAQWLIRKKPTDFKTIVDQIFDRSKNNSGGVPSGLMKIQNETNGYREADLIILAARPGMGKTALMLFEAKSQAIKGIPVGIFSCEMSEIDLSRRMLAEFSGVDSSKISKNKLTDSDWSLMEQKRAKFENLPIHIHDQASLTPMELKLQASKWVREKGVKMIYVDYLQLMSAGGINKSGNREQEISAISRSLKGTAKDLNIPVMALSQLSRAVESRGGMKRPMLSDLRESGAIEQDADIVQFILRPEYYKIEQWDDDEQTSTKNQCEIIYAKYRGGTTFSTVVGCNLKYMRFFDLDSDQDDNFWKDLPVPAQSLVDAFETTEDLKPEKEVPF